MTFYDFTGITMILYDYCTYQVIKRFQTTMTKKIGPERKVPARFRDSGYVRNYSHVMTRRPKYVVSMRFWVLATRLLYSLLTPRRMLQRPFLVNGMSRALS